MAFTPDDLYHCLNQGLADGIIVSDANGTIIDCNPAICKLVGAQAADIVGSRLESIVEFAASSVATEGNTSDRAPTSEDAVSMLDAPASATIFCRNGPELTMPVGQFSLRNSTGRIEGNVTVVYVIQSSTVQQAQTEFVSTVSHELRTPLTSIKGFADTILRAGTKLSTANQRRYVGIIKDQADRLTRLVEDLLAVSRLEARKLQLTIRALDLKEVVERVVRSLFGRSRNHIIVDKIPAGLPDVWADADRLEQILTNLIDNATKYSPAGTKVTITAEETGTNPNMVKFSVNDQGIGIMPEYLPKIFSKFSRIDNPLVRQTEGTGLGLYITRSLVLALGGQIDVDSGPSGTTLTVSLPAASLEDQAARSRGQP